MSDGFQWLKCSPIFFNRGKVVTSARLLENFNILSARCHCHASEKQKYYGPVELSTGLEVCESLVSADIFKFT